MKKFRVKNLTVAVDATNKEARLGCGVNYSCPGGPAGSLCGGFISYGCGGVISYCGGVISYGCPGRSIACFTGTIITCGNFTNPTGCGWNFSTLPPTDITRLIQEVDPVERGGLVSALKTDLSLALEQLELAEKQIEAEAKPQSLEEINELESNLEGALKEVQDMKKKWK